MTPPLFEWFSIDSDDHQVTISANPPGGEVWTHAFAWESVIRVCFKAGGPFDQDELYVFTAVRPESFVIPMEASGAPSFLDELMTRGLFPAEQSIQAAMMEEGEILCWPPAE